MRNGLALAFLFLFLVACEPKKDDVGAASVAFCTKIAAFSGGTLSPMQRDQCQSEYLSLGPNARSCLNPCIAAAKEKADYEVCKDECTSRGGFADAVCFRAADPSVDKDGESCKVGFAKLLASNRPKALCVAKCTRDAPRPSTTTCPARCGAAGF